MLSRILAGAVLSAGLLASTVASAADYTLCYSSACYVVDSVAELNQAAGATLSTAPDGIRVLAVTSGSGFVAAMGIQAGDTIRSANGFSVGTQQALHQQVIKAKLQFGGQLILDVRSASGISNSLEARVF